MARALGRWRVMEPSARTVTIGNVLLRVRDIRSARVDPAELAGTGYSFPKRDPKAPWTLVWMAELVGPIAIEGDHLQTLRTAIEGDRDVT